MALSKCCTIIIIIIIIIITIIIIDAWRGLKEGAQINRDYISSIRRRDVAGDNPEYTVDCIAC